MRKQPQRMNHFASRYRNIAFGVLVAAVSIGALCILWPFITAILWAIVLTVLMTPFYKKIRLRRSPNVASLVSVFSAIALVTVPLLIVLFAMGLQVNGFIQDLQSTTPDGEGLSIQHLSLKLDEALKPTMTSLGVKNFSAYQFVQENRDSLARNASQIATKGAVGVGHTLFMLVVAFLTMFFLLRDGHKLKQPMLELIPLPQSKSEEIMQRTADTIFAVFASVVLVGIVQGALAGIFYWICGVPGALLWGIASIVLCFIPLLGAPIIYIPLSLILLVQGKTWNGIALAALCLIFVSNIDNVLKPWIIGSRAQLHPMAVFFSLLGGVFVLGPIGLMAGPMLLTVALALQDIIRERLKIERAADANAALESGLVAGP